MSGICGIYSLTDVTQASQAILNKMLAVIDPLNSGRRRSFVDLTAGVALGHTGCPTIKGQTFSVQQNWNEDGNHVAVLDGAIANSADFLPPRGRAWHQGSSPRAAVEYLRQAPLDFPMQLTGQFCLTVWAKKQKELWLVHVGVGKKPLYYAYFPNVILLFASEWKSILAHPAFSSVMNQKALTAYLNLGYVPSPLNLLEGIQKTVPGEALRITELGRMTRRQIGKATNHTRFPRLESQSNGR